MSIEVITMVFRRWPRGLKNMKLLAIALADCANSDGTRIFPSVATLSIMSEQSERSVQRQLGELLAAGWLVLVRKSSGRRGDSTEYRISPEWIAGGDIVAPAATPDRCTAATGDKLTPVQGDDSSPSTGDKVAPVRQGRAGSMEGASVKAVDKREGRVTNSTPRVTKTPSTGDTAVSPNPSLPVIEPIPPLPPVETGGCGKPEQPGSPGARPPWRWGDTRSGIEARGRELGVGGWDQVAFECGRGEAFPRYRARVLVAHMAAEGVAVRVSQVLQLFSRLPDASNADVLRKLAGGDP